MRKGTRNTIIASAAVCVAALFAALACLALYPSAASMYVDKEYYTGEVIVEYNDVHGNHDSWTAITQEDIDTDGTYTISTAGKYYLSGDLTANITVTAMEGVDLCLNGYELTCNDAGSSAILIGNTSSSTNVVFSLYDCGGSETDGEYDSVHYYRYRGDVEIEGETFHTGFDFSDVGIDPSDPDTYDGYVRGGLITGAGSLAGTRGCVTVGFGCTFNMYGGTIAGNATSGGGNSAGVLVYKSTFNMYGGTIAGNQDIHSTSNSSGGSGAGVGLCSEGSSSVATINMYGGEIRENYSKDLGGAGIRARYSVTNSTFAVRIYGGAVSGNVSNNSSSSESGGGIELYISPSSTGNASLFYMSGGTVRDNVSRYGGGGIYLSGNLNRDNCEIVGGSVYGNRVFYTSGVGGGVCINNSNGVTLGGTAYIYGNYVNGKVSNLDLYSSNASDACITLSSSLPLTDGARIGVTVNSAQTQITTNYFDGAEAYFISDERAYRVTVGDSCLQLTSK